MPFRFRRSPGNQVSFRIFVASPIELVSSPESEPALESANIKTLLTSIRLSFSYHVLRPVSESLSYQALTATRPQFIESSWKPSQLARKVHVEKQILATVAESHGMSCRPRAV